MPAEMRDSHKATSVSDLLELLEYEFCRSHRRPDYWRIGDRKYPELTDAHDAVGWLVGRLFNWRNRELRRLDPQRPRYLSRTVLSKAIGVSGQRLGEFLRGKSTQNEEWTQIGYRALRELLDSFAEGAPAVQNPVGARVLQFFFPRGDSEEQSDDAKNVNGLGSGPVNGGVASTSDAPRVHNPWYFSERIRCSNSPESIQEVEHELRSFAYAARTNRTTGRIVRVSGCGRFRQVDSTKERLTHTGELTVACLGEGIQVLFVVPDCGAHGSTLESVQSAEAFLRLAAAHPTFAQRQSELEDRLQIVRVAPHHYVDDGARRRFAFEYFSDLRWQFYDRKDNQECLIISRDTSLMSPSAFHPLPEEIRRFRRWLKLFVDGG
jgi:hypothetical protein